MADFSRSRYRWSPDYRPVNLNAVAATNYHGCIGLPQELIDHILDMLCDDLRSLKACSLTCKAMFASTRPLIHQTLYLSVANNRKILTGREWEKFHLSTTERNLRALRFLSHAGGHGLFQYTRRVYFRSYEQFTPDILLPHLSYFQTLRRVHTLTMEDSSCLGREWEGYHKTCFSHFYPTLTSLTIRDGHVESFQAVMKFALQFPNLENLSLERVYRSEWSDSRWPVPDDFDHPPPLCGHLRLAGRNTLALWPVDPINKLPRIFHFRSVELTDVVESDTRILNTCVGSLEDLTVVPRREELNGLPLLDLTKFTILCRFTLCVPFVLRSASGRRESDFSTLLRVLLTIVSPSFRELVLELYDNSSPFGGPPLYSSLFPEEQDRWGGVDKFLEERFFGRGDVKVIIRPSERYDSLTFESFARENFPLMASRGCIHLEPVVGRGSRRMSR